MCKFLVLGSNYVSISNLETNALTYSYYSPPFNSYNAPVSVTKAIQVTNSRSVSVNISFAQVIISAGYILGDFIRSTGLPNSISGTFQPLDGIYNMSGVTTAEEYQTALRSLTFQNLVYNINDPTISHNKTISFGVVDQRGSKSNVAQRKVHVTTGNRIYTDSNPRHISLG